MSKVTSLDAPPLLSPHEAMCWKAGYNQAVDALGARLIAAEKLLLECDEVIEIFQGDDDIEMAGIVLAGIEQHFEDYPEPLE